MKPVLIENIYFFLLGRRTSNKESFHYLKIPDDEKKTMDDWMRIRLAIFNPKIRRQAAFRYAKIASFGRSSKIRKELESSAQFILDLFTKNNTDKELMNFGGMSVFKYPSNRLLALSYFSKVNTESEEDYKHLYNLLMRILKGSLWELWCIAGK